jgi:chromosome segregation ATPase
MSMDYVKRLRELAGNYRIGSDERRDLLDAALVVAAAASPTINVTMECPVKQIECAQRIGEDRPLADALGEKGIREIQTKLDDKSRWLNELLEEREKIRADLIRIRRERDAAKADAESRQRVGDAIRDELGLSDGDHVLQAIDELRGDLEEQRSLKETALADLKRIRGERDHLAKREMERALLCREAGDRCEEIAAERDRYQERVKQLEQRLHVMRKISDGRLVVE